MTGSKEFWERNIALYRERDLYYTSDQVNTSYPRRFASVWIPLSACGGLDEIVDKMRHTIGYKPMFMYSVLPDDELDLEGWYEYSICINDDEEFPIDARIEVEVCNAQSDDCGDMYYIDIDKDDQKIIYEILDKELEDWTNEGCAEHLKRAREEMMDTYCDTIQGSTTGWW